MVILLTMVGCMYPAIDLTAGEKERGTMETLLVSPATRLELVLGKFLTTLLAGMITTTLTVFSQFTGISTLMRGTGESLSFHMNPQAVALIFVMFIPLAAMIAAALIAIAVSARSYKEAQSYISPLMILMIIPAFTSMVPGLEVDLRLAFVPIVNVSLILRNAFLEIYDPTLIILTFLSTVVYAGIALFIAVRIFQKETVLLRT
jgi:sodium transport system permease protein